MLKILYPIFGFCLLVLFVVFCVPVYETLFYSDTGDFSYNLFDNEVYLPIALINVGVNLVLCAIFYYAINSVRFSRWYHWLIILIISALVNF